MIHRLSGREVWLGGNVAVLVEDRHPLVCCLGLDDLEDAVTHVLDGIRRPHGRRVEEALVGEQFAVEVNRIEERQEQVLEQVSALDPATVARHHGVIVERRECRAALRVRDR